MSGDIRISATRWWMKAGWSFRDVLSSALKHIPDSMPALKHLVNERIEGFNYLALDTDCTTEEVGALLDALRKGYQDTHAAGPSSFGDPAFFPSYIEGFAELIRMIESEFHDKSEDSSP